LTLNDDGKLVILNEQDELETIGHITEDDILIRGITRFINTAIIEGCSITSQYETNMNRIIDNLDGAGVVLDYNTDTNEVSHNGTVVQLDKFIKTFQ